MKTLLPVLTAGLLLLSGCYDLGLDNTWGEGDYEDAMGTNGLGRLAGTVFDTEFDAPADLWVNSYDGWVDLTATTAPDANGTMGMMFVMGGISIDELFEPGVRSYGGELEVLLCGDDGREGYDEPADDVEIEVTEREDGKRDVLFTGTARNGRRFQELRFTLDGETLAPVTD